jgi:hypothetical protein
LSQAESTAEASATSRDARDHPIRSPAPLLWALLTQEVPPAQMQSAAVPTISAETQSS